MKVDNYKMPRKLYIAHRIIDRKYVKELCFKLQRIGIETLNPFYNSDGSWKEDRPEIKKIDEGKLDPYYIRTRKKAVQIVTGDLQLIQEADGVIAYISQASLGTAMECFFCSWILHKPLFVISEKYFKHAWIMTLATERFKNEEQFIRWYKRKYRSKIKSLENEEEK